MARSTARLRSRLSRASLARRVVALLRRLLPRSLQLDRPAPPSRQLSRRLPPRRQVVATALLSMANVVDKGKPISSCRSSQC